jgi:predicted phage terminase large subunit-like protein
MLFPAWWFTQHPATSIIAASHTRGLSEHFSRRLRSIIAENHSQLGYTIAKQHCTSSHWRTTLGGEYFATSVRGAVIGRRADLVIIDDPVKSAAEADSAKSRERVWSWYRSELTTRLKPGARIIVIMTRWHDDDLGGRLLADDPAGWRVVRIPAFAENTSDPDVLGRKSGDPVWPLWEPAAALLDKKRVMGERAWAAMFQQSPHPDQGGLFNVSCFDYLEHGHIETPACIVRAWDLASTAPTSTNNPDWTVGLKLAHDRQGRFTVLDVIRFRGSVRQVEDRIIRAAEEDGREVWVGLPEDPGQAGKSQVSYLTGRLTGFRIAASRETGSKYTRAIPVASQIEAGNVALMRASWNYHFVEELRSFPLGEKDDQVDALVRAFGVASGQQSVARKLNIQLTGR